MRSKYIPGHRIRHPPGDERRLKFRKKLRDVMPVDPRAPKAAVGKPRRQIVRAKEHAESGCRIRQRLEPLRKMRVLQPGVIQNSKDRCEARCAYLVQKLRIKTDVSLLQGRKSLSPVNDRRIPL